MERPVVLLAVVCIVFSATFSVEASLWPRSGNVGPNDRQQRDSSIRNICNRQTPTEKALGSGAYGAAYLVPIDPENSEVGMAVLKVAHAGGEGELLTEIQNYLRAGVHPNIAKVVGVCKDPKEPRLMLEYIKGKTLMNWLIDNYQNKAVPVEEQYTILSQFADALYWIERRKLVHADGHDENLLVIETDQKPLLKVIDFGLAKDRSDAANSGSFYYDVRAFCTIAWELARSEEGYRWRWWRDPSHELSVSTLAKKYQDNKAEGASNPKWVSQVLHMCISALTEQKQKKATSLRRFSKFLGGLAPHPKTQKKA